MNEKKERKINKRWHDQRLAASGDIALYTRILWRKASKMVAQSHLSNTKYLLT